MQLALAIFVIARKTASPSPPAEEQGHYVMLGRSSQSAIEMLAAEIDAQADVTTDSDV
jgi:hypothetical protein